jgi:hypothetical protein
MKATINASCSPLQPRPKPTSIVTAARKSVSTRSALDRQDDRPNGTGRPCIGIRLWTVGGRPSGDPRQEREVVAVEWDLGLQGVAILLVMSLAFGVFTQVMFWNHAAR